MPNSEFLRDLIMTVVFLIPVLGLVWKGAKMHARLETLEERQKEEFQKCEKSLTLLTDKLEHERVATDAAIASIINTLTDIKTSQARIEEKIVTFEKFIDKLPTKDN